MMNSEFSDLSRRLNFQPNKINGFAESWEAALAKPREFSTQSDQWLTGGLAAPQFRGTPICAPQSGGAHRLVHPAWGFNRVGWNPVGKSGSRSVRRNRSALTVERTTQFCVVLIQHLSGLQPAPDYPQTVGYSDE